MLRKKRNSKHEVFKRMMKCIPEWKVNAIELNNLLEQYQRVLRLRAEERLGQREELITEANVDVEMSRINAEDAHAVAQEYAEGKGIFAELYNGMEKVPVHDSNGIKHYEWKKARDVIN